MFIGRVSFNKRVFPVIYSPKEGLVYEIFGTINDVLKIEENEVDVSSTGIDVQNITILPPVIPTKIVAVARNYVEHAKELNHGVPKEPLIFFKPPSCLLPHGGAVIYPKISQRVDYEGELALVIKKTIKKAKTREIEKKPQEFFGYTAFLDMTARDLQNKDKLWTRAKGFDTFGPIGPWIEINPLPKSLNIKTYINDELKQEGNTKNMIFSPAELIEYISNIMTLETGDIIATGTPAGVGPVKIGDKIKLTIETLEPLKVIIKKE